MAALAGLRRDADAPPRGERYRRWPALGAGQEPCGVLSWAELRTAVDAAPYVVVNNSGVAPRGGPGVLDLVHLCRANHAYNEWMPRGPSAALPCSPCALASERCPKGLSA
jgi:hypothetical protein